MREALFVKQNRARWEATEALLAGGETLPDDLAEAYQELTTDLSFAQTHYPQSRTTDYLNALAFNLHNEIYRNKRERLSRLVTFWTHEMPLTLYDARRELLISAAVFLVSVLIGVVSTLGDAEFPRVVLGDFYVEMTLHNIEAGHPTAVYGNSPELGMFLGITVNNVLVSFRIFAMGLLTSIGSAWMLFENGVMVGAFQTFFARHDVLWPSFLAIWQHGTVEISSCVVSGAAGIALGNGWLFPGTYSRLTSLRRSARRGLKIAVGLVPLFVFAAFIEGFVTRHSELPDGIRLASILLQLVFVVYYFVLLPLKRHRQSLQTS